MHRYFPYTTSKVRCRALLGKRTDTKFIARLCSGQPTAWAQLVDRWSPRLYSYIFYNTGEETVARRLLHSVMAEVIHTVISRPRLNNLSVLIFSIAHRQILYYCRENRAVAKREIVPIESVVRQNNATINAIDGYFFNRFRQFSLETKQILLLRYVCGVTLFELSQIVGQSEEHLLQTIERAKIYFQ